MPMLTSALDNIGIADAGIVALLGYAVVFFGLILLMIVVMVMGKVFTAKDKKATSEPAATPAPAVAKATAPGSAGELKLHDVAMVADKLGKPLNELRFISIKEVK